MTEPDWICIPRGKKYGSKLPEVNPGACEICGEEESVTKSKHFGKIKEDWKKEEKHETE